MSDFWHVYHNWLWDIKQDESARSFVLWLFSITDSQLEEVARKYGTKTLMELFGDEHYAIMTVQSLTHLVRNHRADNTLLVSTEMAEPMHRPDYMSFLIKTQNSTKTWESASDEFLSMAMNYYNCFNSDGFPQHDPKIADLCRNIAAERSLLGNQ